MLQVSVPNEDISDVYEVWPETADLKEGRIQEEDVDKEREKVENRLELEYRKGLNED